MEPKIRERFIDTGKVRLEWRNFAWIGADSRRAAEAAACAHAQGEFWPYQARLYGSQKESSAFKDEKLVGYAIELGLDQAQFSDCLRNNTYTRAVEEEFRAARSQGVTATPTFFVNGKKLVGFQPFEKWVEIIEAALKEKGS